MEPQQIGRSQGGLILQYKLANYLRHVQWFHSERDHILFNYDTFTSTKQNKIYKLTTATPIGYGPRDRRGVAARKRQRTARCERHEPFADVCDRNSFERLWNTNYLISSHPNHIMTIRVQFSPCSHTRGPKQKWGEHEMGRIQSVWYDTSF